jgi:hypothetical protein
MVLLVLMVLTSLALAVMVSVWLVPPYLVLMVWILAPVRGLHDHVPASTEQVSEPVSNGENLPEPAEHGTEIRSQAEPDVAASSPTEAMADQDKVNDPEPVAVKTTRRGKGRGRKAKGGTVVEPAAATATWIQVGPGKFVRVEGPNATANAPAEPPPAVSDGEPADPLASAPPAVEDAEEPDSRELATEVGPEPGGRPANLGVPAARDELVQDEPSTDGVFSSPDAEASLRPSPEEVVLPDEEPVPRELAIEFGSEPEDRPAILDAPAARDEFIQDGPITDNVLSSPDAEAWVRPSPEEVALPELDGSPVEDAEEPVSQEFVAEVSPEPEDRPAIVDAPAARAESSQDEPITDSDFPSSDAEAWLRPSPEEVVLPGLEGSPNDESQLDENCVDEGACEDAPASEEAVAEVREESDGPAVVTGEGLSATSGLEDSEIGPVEPSGDQGITLDASDDLARTTETENLLLEATRDARSPSIRSISSPSRSTDTAPFVSWRGAWPRVGRASGRISGMRPPGRVVRSGPKARVAPGSRRRSRRGAGAYRLVCRTFPPRSPPVCGRIRRFEAGRGVRRHD